MSKATAQRPKKRPWRRWVALAAVVVPVWYVGAWLTVSFCLSRGYIPAAYGTQIAVPFKPLIAYANSERFGAENLKRLFCHVMREDARNVYRSLGSPQDDVVVFTVQMGPLSPDIGGMLIQEVVRDYGESDAPN